MGLFEDGNNGVWWWEMVGVKVTGFWLENLLNWEGKPRRGISLEIKSRKLIFDILQLRYLRCS